MEIRSIVPTQAEVETPPEPGRSRAELIVLGLVAAGIALRVLQYIPNRSIWLDESLLVWNLRHHGFWELVRGPFDYGQTAPIGFVALVKGCMALFGTSEYSLRLVPLLAGIGGVLLIPSVASRYVSRRAVPIAVGLFALAPFLIYYSSEVKQYALDTLIALILLRMAPGVIRMERRALPWFILAGVLAPWFSQPSLFILAAIGMIALWRAVRTARGGDRAALAPLLVLGLSWALSAAGAFWVASRSISDPQYMAIFWRSGFAPWETGPLAVARWVAASFVRMFREPMGAVGRDASGLEWGQVIAGAVAFIAGVALYTRRRRIRMWVLLLPLLLTLLAALARQYPFAARWDTSGRLLMFLLPSLALIMAEGVARLPDLTRSRLALACSALLMVGIAAPTLTYAAVMVPQVRSEAKPLLEYGTARLAPGDMLYVYYNGRFVWDYYGSRYGWAPDRVLIGSCSRLEPVGYLRDLDPLRGHPRVWLFFVGGGGVEGFDEKDLILDYLDHVGRRLDDRVSHGASLYLYDLRRKPGPEAPFTATIPVFSRERVDMACRGPWDPRPPGQQTSDPGWTGLRSYNNELIDKDFPTR
jgi:hypothetical protein